MYRFPWQNVSFPFYLIQYWCRFLRRPPPTPHPLPLLLLFRAMQMLLCLLFILLLTVTLKEETITKCGRNKRSHVSGAKCGRCFYRCRKKNEKKKTSVGLHYGRTLYFTVHLRTLRYASELGNSRDSTHTTTPVTPLFASLFVSKMALNLQFS